MGLIQKLNDSMVEQSLARSTMQGYRFWNRKFYGHARKPASQWLGADVKAFLLWLYEEKYSPVSRKQALNALAFTFKHVLKADMGNLDLPPMPKVHHTNRILPSPLELSRILVGMKGMPKTMAQLMAGSGLRVAECCKLRVQDVDIDALTIRVWFGKGDKCRRTIIPQSLVPDLQRHLALRKALHDRDLAEGCGLVELPGRLDKKYRQANREFRQQWFFPSTKFRGQYRWHAVPECVGKPMRRALREAGILKHITPHCLRHFFITYSQRVGNDLKTVMGWAGHTSAETTMIYTHPNAANGISPLDCMEARPVVLVPPMEPRRIEFSV